MPRATRRQIITLDRAAHHRCLAEEGHPDLSEADQAFLVLRAMTFGAVGHPN
jgi:hypothetical protein